MLHKNRSKNRNRWKFTLILPLLALFIFSFNTKEIYIEKEIPTTNFSEAINYSSIEDIIPLVDNVLNKEQNSSINQKAIAKKQNVSKSKITANKIVEVIITKDFSEADFKKIKEEFADAGFTLKFKGIKRNENNEITAIKIEASSKKSNANFNSNSEDPIKPIKITIDNENNSITIGNGSEHHFGKSKGYSFISKDGNHKIHTSGKGNSVFIHESDDDNHDDNDHDNVFIIKKNGKVHEVKNVHKDKKVHVIRGDEGTVFELKSDDGSLLEIKGKHKDGKVIINENSIVWKHDDKNIWTTDDDSTIEIKSLGKGKNNIFISGDSDKEPLFFLDGKEVSKKVIDELDSDTIDKVEVLKGDSATKEYGKKAKDGVVLITTKKKE